MSNIFKLSRVLEKIGLGGLTALIGFGGFAFWFHAGRNYRLVLRDEHSFLETPTIFIVAGFGLSLFAMALLKKLARLQKRDVGWYWTKGGKSLSRGGPLRWEDVLFGVVPGVVLATIGAGKFVNCALDGSRAKTDTTTLLKNYVHTRNKGGASFIWVLKDWKNTPHEIDFFVSREEYESCEEGAPIVVTTKNGSLGYEWLISFQSVKTGE